MATIECMGWWQFYERWYWNESEGSWGQPAGCISRGCTERHRFVRGDTGQVSCLWRCVTRAAPCTYWWRTSDYPYMEAWRKQYELDLLEGQIRVALLFWISLHIATGWRQNQHLLLAGGHILPRVCTMEATGGCLHKFFTRFQLIWHMTIWFLAPLHF